MWSYPSTECIQFAKKEQIATWKIKRIKELHDTRNTRFYLRNFKTIPEYVKEHIKT